MTTSQKLPCEAVSKWFTEVNALASALNDKLREWPDVYKGFGTLEYVAGGFQSDIERSLLKLRGSIHLDAEKQSNE